ncbi:MAG: HD domain-containing protein [Desulfatibacillaceae bacterium]
MSDDDAKKLARFVYEALHTKRVARSGWWVAGVDLPESVAEHGFGTALIAYLLAVMEGADAERAMAMAVFHDVPEARFNDLHKVAQRYVDVDRAEMDAARDQAASLPDAIGSRYRELHEELRKRRTPEALVVRDADLIECLAQARYYEQRGFPVSEWIVNSEKGVTTQSGRKLAAALRSMPPKTWYEGLKAHLPGGE